MDHTSVRLYNYIENCCEYVYVYVCVYMYIYSYINSYEPLPELIEGSIAILRLWYGSVISSTYLFIPLPLPSLQPSMPTPRWHTQIMNQYYSVSTMILFLEVVFQSPTRKAESSLSFQPEGIQWGKFFTQLIRELRSPQGKAKQSVGYIQAIEAPVTPRLESQREEAVLPEPRRWKRPPKAGIRGVCVVGTEATEEVQLQTVPADLKTAISPVVLQNKKTEQGGFDCKEGREIWINSKHRNYFHI